MQSSVMEVSDRHVVCVGALGDDSQCCLVELLPFVLDTLRELTP